MLKAEEMYNNAAALFNAGKVPEAHKLCVALIRSGQLMAQSYHLLAQINISLQQLHKASELCKHAIKHDRRIDYRVTLCRIYALLGQTDAVLALVDTITPSMVSTAEQADTLGVALSGCNEHEKALAYFAIAIKHTKQPQVIYNYAVSSKFCGHLNDARHALQQVLALDSSYYQAHFALSELTEGDDVARHIAQLTELLTSDDLSLAATMHLSHALAREKEKQGAFTAAFELLLSAKAHKAKQIPYEPQLDNALFDYLSNHFQSPQTVSSTFSVSQSARPIFVVGMPRSGTTLVERILSSHGDVSSGGELQDFSTIVKALSGSSGNHVLDVATLEKAENIDYDLLANTYLSRTKHIGNTSFFVDKLPFNFFYLPYIRRAFPNAKIICLMRDPIDTCVGNFRQLFSIYNPHYNYTQSLLDCARFYTQFEHWVSQWANIDKDNFKLIAYEALTANPTQIIPELIDFCDLPWDDNCLHMEDNAAPVATASKMQVKQPINQSFTGRWKRYRPYTDALESYFS